MRPDPVPDAVRIARGRAAARVHDLFNVCVITPLVALTLHALHTGSHADELRLTHITLAYIMVDTAWHMVVPHCQPHALRWVTIIVHHAFTAWLLLHPIVTAPEHASFTPLALLVELNTLVHNVNKRWPSPVMAVAFYLSWTGLRLIWFPYLVWRLHLLMTGWGSVPWVSLAYWQVVGSQLALSLLNYFWSLELVIPLVLGKKKQQ